VGEEQDEENLEEAGQSADENASQQRPYLRGGLPDRGKDAKDWLGNFG
jgi:hypothetical protein